LLSEDCESCKESREVVTLEKFWGKLTKALKIANMF
jgi:hypothetical protein